MKKFDRLDEYLNWTETLEDEDECKNTPVLIDDGWNANMDMFTKCKSWKVALNRFGRIFKEVDGLDGWYESMREAGENKIFSDSSITGWYTREQQEEEARRFGAFGWGIEEVDEGEWYIFLNLSGAYAGHEVEW